MTQLRSRMTDPEVMVGRGGYKREAKYWAEVAAQSDANKPASTQPRTPEDLQKARWFAAMRWRRAVEEVTLQVGLTFTQWLVLDAIRELYAETGDASIQNEISVRVELDRSTVSQVMQKLERKGLVDRGIDIIGTAWRTLLTERAKSLLIELRPRIGQIGDAAPRGRDP